MEVRKRQLVLKIEKFALTLFACLQVVAALTQPQPPTSSNVAIQDTVHTIMMNTTKLFKSDQASACDGEQLSIKCNESYNIEIIKVHSLAIPNEEAQLNKICRPQLMEDRCEQKAVAANFSRDYNTLVNHECKSRNSCNLNLTQQDEICGSRLMLVVVYRCRPVKMSRRVVCGGEQLLLECPEGKRLLPTSASYGAQANDTKNAEKCRAAPGSTCLAGGGKALMALQDHCLFQRRCELQVDSSLFGNPQCAVGQAEYLQVVFTCANESMLQMDAKPTTTPKLSVPVKALRSRESMSQLSRADSWTPSERVRYLVHVYESQLVIVAMAICSILVVAFLARGCMALRKNRSRNSITSSKDSKDSGKSNLCSSSSSSGQIKHNSCSESCFSLDLNSPAPATPLDSTAGDFPARPKLWNIYANEQRSTNNYTLRPTRTFVGQSQIQHQHQQNPYQVQNGAWLPPPPPPTLHQTAPVQHEHCAFHQLQQQHQLHHQQISQQQQQVATEDLRQFQSTFASMQTQ